MKIFKFMMLLMLAFNIFILFNSNIAYAEESYMQKIESQASGFLNKGKEEAGELNEIEDAVSENFVGIGQILTFIGVGVLIGVTTYLGIQYFISPPDKQGALKEKLITILVSTVVIFGAYNIWKLVLNIVQNLD